MGVSVTDAGPAGSGESNTAVKRVLDEVLSGLRKGRYVPGQRLVAAELAGKLGISQIPVREAIHILSGKGIVELIPRRGARIRALSTREFLNVLEVWIGICRLNYLDAAKVLSVAADRQNLSAQLQSLQDIKQAIQLAGKNRIAIDFFNSYVQLYDICAEINANPYLNSIRSPLPVELYYRHVADFLPGPYWEEYITNISSIIDAIAAGEPAQFTDIWDNHISMITDYLQSELEKRQ